MSSTQELCIVSVFNLQLTMENTGKTDHIPIYTEVFFGKLLEQTIPEEKHVSGLI